MVEFSKWKYVNMLSFIIFLVYLLGQDFLAKPWHDELCFTDTAINYVTKGEWYSNVWNYTYQPLYEYVLIGWLKVFGVSHAVVCNLNIVLSFIVFLLLERELLRRGLMTKPSTGYLFVVAYWFEFYFASLMTKGRIDIMSLLFTLVLISNIMILGLKWKRLALVFISSVLLMGTTIYNIPVVSFFILCLWIFNYNGAGRKEWFVKGMVTLCGFSLSFFLICVFYYRQELLLYYLSSFFTFQNTEELGFLNKLASSYATISSLLLILAGAVLTIRRYGRKSRQVSWLVIIMLVPVFMIISGRYQSYYSWMFIIPMLIYILSAFDTVRGRFRIYATISIAAVSAILRVSYNIKVRPQEYALRQAIKNEVASSVSVKTNENVYITNDFIYYPMVDERKEIYYLLNDNDKLSDKVTNSPIVKYLLGKGYKEPVPTLRLPNEGLMVSIGEEESLRNQSKLTGQGYKCTVVETTPKLIYVKFEKNIVKKLKSS